jgi:hypothetical protein
VHAMMAPTYGFAPQQQQQQFAPQQQQQMYAPSQVNQGYGYPHQQQHQPQFAQNNGWGQYPQQQQQQQQQQPASVSIPMAELFEMFRGMRGQSASAAPPVDANMAVDDGLAAAGPSRSKRGRLAGGVPSGQDDAALAASEAQRLIGAQVSRARAAASARGTHVSSVMPNQFAEHIDFINNTMNAAGEDGPDRLLSVSTLGEIREKLTAAAAYAEIQKGLTDSICEEAVSDLRAVYASNPTMLAEIERIKGDVPAILNQRRLVRAQMAAPVDQHAEYRASASSNSRAPVPSQDYNNRRAAAAPSAANIAAMHQLAGRQTAYSEVGPAMGAGFAAQHGPAIKASASMFGADTARQSVRSLFRGMTSDIDIDHLRGPSELK